MAWSSVCCLKESASNYFKDSGARGESAFPLREDESWVALWKQKVFLSRFQLGFYSNNDVTKQGRLSLSFCWDFFYFTKIFSFLEFSRI